MYNGDKTLDKVITRCTMETKHLKGNYQMYNGDKTLDLR